LVPKLHAARRKTSVVSVSHIQSIQLEQADVQHGMNVLEIGSGSYNAALILEIAGPTGSLTTVDIDADIVDRARAGLATAGYAQVDIVPAAMWVGSGRRASARVTASAFAARVVANYTTVVQRSLASPSPGARSSNG
jgi:protein-L-isoaspartate O-methyltransferase